MTAWTEERRRKQAEAIRKHRPWEKSTGPRSKKGKARSSLNALKHGSYNRDMQDLRKCLQHQRAFLTLFVAFCRNGEKNELIKTCLKSDA